MEERRWVLIWEPNCSLPSWQALGTISVWSDGVTLFIYLRTGNCQLVLKLPTGLHAHSNSVSTAYLLPLLYESIILHCDISTYIYIYNINFSVRATGQSNGAREIQRKWVLSPTLRTPYGTTRYSDFPPCAPNWATELPFAINVPAILFLRLSGLQDWQLQKHRIDFSTKPLILSFSFWLQSQTKNFPRKTEGNARDQTLIRCKWKEHRVPQTFFCFQNIL